MRVIFLDFDGVLNVESEVEDDSQELWTAAWLDPAMVGRLSRLVEITRALLVISSSWRRRRSVDELSAILAAQGCSHGVLDVTPRLPRPPEGESLVRANEVRAWLEAHDDVEQFAILDDEREFGELAEHHVRIDPTLGLTDADIERAKALLLAEKRAVLLR